MTAHNPSEKALRQELIRFSHLCYERNMLVALDGNLSARLPDGNILCTQAGCHKGLLTDDHLVVIDPSGKQLRGRGRPTSEMQMHLACYEERPDCRAVIHAHPPFAIAFTLAGETMARCVLPEVVLTLGVVPTVEYATTGTKDLADKLRPVVRQHDALIMDTHGVVALGTSVLEAFCRLEIVEHTARITKLARDMGGAKELPAEEAIRLRSMGLKRYGGPPDAVARADEPCADLPQVCTGCTGCSNPNPSGIAPRLGDFSVARMVAVAGPPPVPTGVRSVVEEEVLRALRELTR